MLAVGALAPLSYGRLGKSWKHAEGLKELARYVATMNTKRGKMQLTNAENWSAIHQPRSLWMSSGIHTKREMRDRLEIHERILLQWIGRRKDKAKDIKMEVHEVENERYLRPPHWLRPLTCCRLIIPHSLFLRSLICLDLWCFRSTRLLCCANGC